MKKLYFTGLIISGTLSAVAAISGMLLAILVLTVGIGTIVLIAAVNLFIVLLCLLPVVLFSKPASYLLAVLLLAAAFFGPGVLSDRAEQEIARVEQKADIQRNSAFSVHDSIGLELIRPVSADTNLRASFAAAYANVRCVVVRLIGCGSLHKARKKTPRPTQAGAAAIASMLDQKGPIPAAFDGEIDGWLYGLNHVSEMTPAEIEIVMRIANDPQLPDETGVRSLFARKKGLQAIMLPWLFDRLEQEPAFKKKFISWLTFELSLGSIPIDALAPYAPRFRRLLKEERHKTVLPR